MESTDVSTWRKMYSFMIEEYWHNFICLWPVEFNSGGLHEYGHHWRKWFCLPQQPLNSVSCSGKCDGSHEQPPTVMEWWQLTVSYTDSHCSACSWVQWPCHAHRTVFHSISPALFLALTFILLPLSQSSLILGGNDIDVLLRDEQKTVTYCQLWANSLCELAVTYY